METTFPEGDAGVNCGLSPQRRKAEYFWRIYAVLRDLSKNCLITGAGALDLTSGYLAGCVIRCNDPVLTTASEGGPTCGPFFWGTRSGVFDPERETATARRFPELTSRWQTPDPIAQLFPPSTIENDSCRSAAPCGMGPRIPPRD